MCITHVSLMYHLCITYVSLMSHLCITHVSLTYHSCITHVSLMSLSTCITLWSTLQSCMFLGNQGDTKRCARVSSRLVQIRGVLPCLSFQLLATPQGACSAQKRPAKHAPKIVSHLLNPQGRTCTARDQFSAPFAVIKQYHVSGNTVVNSYLKIRNNDDMDFAPKMNFFRTLKISRELGMCSKSFGTN